MKTFLTSALLCIALVTVISFAQAQNGAGVGPPWAVQGNSINAAIHFMGSSNNADVVFKANNLEGARLKADGKFGIGTATPVSRLTITGEGATNATSAFDVKNSANTTMFRILDNGSAGLNTSSPTSTLDIHGDLTFENVLGDKISLFDDRIGLTTMYGFGVEAGGLYYKSNNEHNWYIQTNAGAGPAEMTLNPDGLGIGTTNPESALDVHGELTFEGVTGDKISLFDDRIGLTTMYGFGVSDGFLHYKSNGAHKWYSQSNAGSGSAHMTLTNGGFLGLGTETPNVNLTIEGANARMVLRDNAGNNSENAARIELLEYAGGNFDGGAFLWWNGDSNRLLVGTKLSGVNENVMVIDRSTLSVGIGTQTFSNNYRLSVNGAIRAKEVMVESGWADFVFDENYALASLEEVEAYINANKRLPGIPAAEEIRENGMAVGDISTKLLMKIEELTLYVIELKKENNELKRSVEELSGK